MKYRFREYTGGRQVDGKYVISFYSKCYCGYRYCFHFREISKENCQVILAAEWIL